MFNRFASMAGEYYDLTGGNIQVNSAKRSGKGSVHNYGYAIDINSSDANELNKLGLLDKYGFHRPLLNWGKYPGGKNEPWHIEPYPGNEIYGPKNTINQQFRKNVLMRAERGDGGFNMPRGKIEDKIESSKPIQVSLSNSDLIKLAELFGEQIKRNKDINKNNFGNTQMVNPRVL
jgi:hypothetical protein